MRHLCKLLLALLPLQGISCQKKDVTVRIAVDVKTNQGAPVDAAQIILDNSPLGVTNNAGIFSTELQLKVGVRRRLEVKKESDINYFAPHYESFVVGEASRQDINIPAVLYFVPKPSSPANPQVGSASPTPVPADLQAAAHSPQPSNNNESATTDDEQAPLVGSPQPAASEETLSTADLATADPNQASANTASKTPATVAEGSVADKVASADTPPTPDKEANATDEQVSVAVEDNSHSTTSAAPATNLAQGTLLPVLGDTDLKDEKPVLSYPKNKPATTGSLVFTVHAYSHGTPLEGVQINTGTEEDGDLKFACETNKRGRCALHLERLPTSNLTFVAVKKGYRTAKKTTHIKDQGKLVLAMEAGHTIDIYAVSKAFNFTKGLAGVEIKVAGKTAGVTDNFGHLSYLYVGKTDDLISIAMKAKGYLPETFETDFVASGPMKLVRNFAPIKPPAARLAVLGVRPAGAITQEQAQLLTRETDSLVRAAADKNLFSSPAFKELQQALFLNSLSKLGLTPFSITQEGWAESDLKSKLDGLLLPTIIFADKTYLELSIIDSQAKIIAAAKEPLTDLKDKAAITKAMDAVYKRLNRAFPFEGAVLEKSGAKVTINIGYAAGRSIKAGDMLDVFGTQSEKQGRSKTFSKIARIVVREVFDDKAIANLVKQEPRSVIERGDTIRLRPRQSEEQKGTKIAVTTEGSAATPLAQANIYLNDAWIGATDESGIFQASANGSGSLKVIKNGYQPRSLDVTFKDDEQVKIAMKRETALLRIESRPPGLAVRIDGELVGKTPLASPIAVASGFVKLAIDAPKGYKPFTQVLELDQGTLELVGANAIVLERDERSEALKLLSAGDTEGAIKKYLTIAKDHSDWLIAQHELGEIYLTRLEQPAKAAEAFGRVTADAAVKDFSDKRFITSHINEAIALFMTAEKLMEGHPEAAAAHYKKAKTIFDGTIPYLRYIKGEQYADAVHNTDYHRALARHRLWQLSKDPNVLAETVRSWRSYLDTTARSVHGNNQQQALVDSAMVYFKQASAARSNPGIVR